MIDLHSHTLYSDGTDTPEALALKADALGVYAQALTDHDTLDGIPRFLAMQPQVKTRLIVGTELSCIFLGKSLHVLGLLVNPLDAVFQRRLVELRQRRENRNERMVQKLQSLDIPIALEHVQRYADSPLLSRVHFALALVELGAVATKEEAFAKLIGDGCPGFVDREELSPSEAARWIWEAGGVPMVAHPGRFMMHGFRWDEAMPKLREQGMAGFEAYYGGYSQAEQEYFVALAQRLGMAMSGGSDYHGANKPGIQPGVGRGGLRVPNDLLDQLERVRMRGH